jgi:predicted Zn-dependent protease
MNRTHRFLLPGTIRASTALLLSFICVAAAPGELDISRHGGDIADIHRADRADPDLILDAMGTELNRSFSRLQEEGETPIYYLSYGLTEIGETSVVGILGTVNSRRSERNRYLDVDVRLGDMDFDNTRESRTQRLGGFRRMTRAPLDDDELALRIAFWKRTDTVFKEAQEHYANLRTEASLESEREDPSGDFSAADPVEYIEPLASVEIDMKEWENRVSRYSQFFEGHSYLYRSRVELTATTTDKYMVNSEGTRTLVSAVSLRLVVYAWTKADDGMELYLYEIYDVNPPNGFPDEETVRNDIARLIDNLEELRTAPVVDPYAGPAILQNQAAAVYFHEIFGHRIEGHRQKSEREGQTFTAMVGEQILPEFMDIYDDPRLTEYAGEDLKGHYMVDDEGVMAERADIVTDGVLTNFLMSRSPIKGFPASNGHGRRQNGYRTVSRQGNLVIESSNSIPYHDLREQLIEQVRLQEKPYGLIFSDISGGFTSTGRTGPQSYKVEPLLVYRVYPDGRPDELVRGVDIVGTPLTSLSKIEITGDDPGIFDGFCGAESGSVPVSAVSPSLLVTEIEVEKQRKAPTGPPELPMPPMTPEISFAEWTPSENVQRALQSEQVLQAMGDELGRSMNELKLPDSEAPYHLLYRIDDRDRWNVDASFGAVIMDLERSTRYATITLRVGDRTFDNTQFVGRMGPGRPGFAAAPIGDGYGAVRHALWLATDNTYRDALGVLAAKRAFAQNTVIKEKPDDFAAGTQNISVDMDVPSDLDREEWRERIREVSALFRSAEDLQSSDVRLSADNRVTRLVDSEGTVIRQTSTEYELIIAVQTQAEDGSSIADYRSWRVRSPGDLPGRRTMLSEASNLITELQALTAAPEGEPFVGPVLLADQAAGAFFAQLFAEELANPRSPLLENETFAAFFDPTNEAFDRIQLIGHYQFDDEGIAAQPLVVVEDGWLRNLPMSRTPTRELKESNGHGRSSPGEFVKGRPTNLHVSTSEPESLRDLERRLVELAELSQSPYGILITRMHMPEVQSQVDREGLTQQRANDAAIASPQLAYRVYVEDGRRELVRGYFFDEIVVRTLKDIIGATNGEHLVQTVMGGYVEGIGISVVAPDILLEEVVLGEVTGTRATLPYLSRPIQN